jgi:hypothetical protein
MISLSSKSHRLKDIILNFLMKSASAPLTDDKKVYLLLLFIFLFEASPFLLLPKLPRKRSWYGIFFY